MDINRLEITYRLILVLLIFVLPGNLFGAYDVYHGADVNLTGDEAKLIWHNGDYYWSLSANSSLAANFNWVWPANAGSNGQQLTTDGAGVFSWVDPGGAGGAGDISDVWSVTSGNVNALTAAAGDSLNASGADSTIPWEVDTTAAPTTEGMAIWDSDNDILAIGDGAGTDYAAYGASDGDALAGDSATGFFDAGTVEHEYGGLEADVSAYSGLVKITGGSTSAVTITAAGEAILDDADAAAQRTTLGLGTIATYAGDQDLQTTDTPTFATVKFGDDEGIEWYVGEDRHNWITSDMDDDSMDISAGLLTLLASGGVQFGQNSEYLLWTLSNVDNDATLSSPTGLNHLDFSDFSMEVGTITAGSWNGTAIDVSSYTNLVAGTNISLSGDTLNVDDAFLINDGDDETTGALTIGGELTVTGYLQADSTVTLLGKDAANDGVGTENVFIGFEAGYNNTFAEDPATGDLNTYVGYQAGKGGATNTGRKNMGLGYRSLFANTEGFSNAAIGPTSLYSNTTGDYNMGIGENALYSNTEGTNNVGIGRGAGLYNNTGNDNIFIGTFAGRGTSANARHRNTFIGPSTGYSVSTGSDNVFIGYKAGYRQTTGSDMLLIDNEISADAATELTHSLIYGLFEDHASGPALTVNGSLTITKELVGAADEITAESGGIAASIATINTEVTTNGDSDLDNVTLANGTSGQIKHIYCVVEGNAADTWKITPATMCGGTQITFAGAGEGCTLIYADSEGWVVTGNNGGTIS